MKKNNVLNVTDLRNPDINSEDDQILKDYLSSEIINETSILSEVNNAMRFLCDFDESGSFQITIKRKGAKKSCSFTYPSYFLFQVLLQCASFVRLRIHHMNEELYHLDSTNINKKEVDDELPF